MRDDMKLSLKMISFLALAAAVPLRAYELKDDGKEVSSRKPVNISASQLTFDRLRSVTLFKGHVKAVHDQVILWADQIRALEENREATAEGHVSVVDPGQGITLSCGNLEYQELMDLMTAHDHPVLNLQDEAGHPVTVQGKQMEVDSDKKTVTVNQNVQILHKQGHAECQRAIFLSREDKCILEGDPEGGPEGDPKVYSDNGILAGRRIVSDMGINRSVMVEGMADAIFNPNGAPVTNSSSQAVSGSKTASQGVSGPTTATGANAPVANTQGLGNNAPPASSSGGGTPGTSPVQPNGFHWQ